MKNPKRTSLNDVAREAGVSLTTVSMVLNSKSDQAAISETTRRRVLDVAFKMNYSPRVPQIFNAHVKTPLRHLSLAYVDQPPASHHEFLDPAICEISRAAGEDDLMIHTTEGLRPDETAAYCEKLRQRESGGLIIFTFDFERPAWLQPFIKSGIPFVVFNRDFGGDIPCVVMDHQGQAYDQVGRLLSLGHRQIGCLGHVSDVSTGPSRQRIEGYRERLRKASVYNPGLEREMPYSLEAAQQIAQQMLKEKPEVTALFCTADLLAVGVLRAAKNMGLSVPGDLSVASMDGYEFSAYTEPPLTTIRYPRPEMGRAALKLLHDVVNNKAPKPPRVILRGDMIPGGSVAQCRSLSRTV